MLVHLPKILKNFEEHHKNLLIFASGQSVWKFSAGLFYAVLPVVLSTFFDEKIAGLAISAFNLLQVVLLDAVGWALSDKIWARNSIRLSHLLISVVAIFWLVFWLGNLTLILGTTLIFLAFSLNQEDAYILKTSPKKEGGLSFWIFWNIVSIASFLATLSIPFFVIEEKFQFLVWILIWFKLAAFWVLSFVKKDEVEEWEKRNLSEVLNPLKTLKHWTHFIRKNKGYPLLAIWSAIFEGLFFGSVYFLFPLYFAEWGGEWLLQSLQLWIYEFVAVFLAGFSGYLADKYNWAHVNSLGWILILVWLAYMPFASIALSFVITGLIIAIWKNLSFYAAEHALEEYDVDHREDWAFSGLKRMSENLGFMLAPLCLGFVYTLYGFKTGISVVAVACSVVVIWMIWQTWKLERN